MVETEDKWRWVTSAGGHIPPTCDPLFKILGALLVFAMRGICERFQCQLPLGLGEGYDIVLPSHTAPANLFLVYHTTLCFSPFTLVVDCSRARAALDITYADRQLVDDRMDDSPMVSCGYLPRFPLLLNMMVYSASGSPSGESISVADISL